MAVRHRTQHIVCLFNITINYTLIYLSLPACISEKSDDGDGQIQSTATQWQVDPGHNMQYAYYHYFYNACTFAHYYSGDEQLIDHFAAS